MKKTGLQGYKKNFIRFLSVFMIVFPWITYLNLEQYTEAEKSIFGGYEGISIDFFLQQKVVVLVLVAVIALLWFLGERFLPQKVDNQVPLLKGNNKVLFVLSGVFVLGTVISTVFSSYQKNALWGSPTVGEGLWVLLGYVVIIFAFYNSFANEYAFDMAKIVITALAGITLFLSLVEWFYKPLLEIGLVQALVAPAKYADIVTQMKAVMFDDAIALTLYNPGYFGGFVCLLLPFVLMYCLQAKKMQEKLLYGGLFAGLLFSVVTANTTTALYIAIFEVVVVLAACLFAVMTGTDTKNSSKQSTAKGLLLQSGGMLVVTIVALLLSGSITGNSFFNIFSNANSVTGNTQAERFVIKDIQMDGNRVVLVGEETNFQIAYVGNKLQFLDGDGKALRTEYQDSEIVFQNKEYEHLTVKVLKPNASMTNVINGVMIDAGYQDTIDFFVLDDGTFSGVGQNASILTDIGDAGTPDALKQFYGIFTGRGYAWVNSLPILKETLLVGKGPGNFAYYFKQFDYMGLLSTHESIKKVIDKPHSAYLQYATEVGLPAAIAFFGIFVMTLVKAVRVFWKNKKQMITNSLHIGAMVSVAGFLIYSVINDSMITVTPVACMIAGLLLASCYVEDPKC